LTKMPTLTTTTTVAAAAGTTTTTVTEATPEKAVLPPPPSEEELIAYPTGKMTVAYWKIRGLAQSIRVLCEFCEIDFENKMFVQTPCPRPIPEALCKGHPFSSMEAYEASKACWFDVKDTILGDYHSPNLPYLIDGDVTLTESNAILRYIGKKAVAKGVSTICGGTPSEVAANEFMLDMAMELRNKVIQIGYATCWPSFVGTIDQLAGQPASAYYDTKAGEFKANIPADCTKFEKYLGGNPYFAGQNVTVCDFHMYELLDQQRCMFGPEIYEGFPQIQAFVARFGALPKVAAAYKKYDLPANNEMSWTTVALGC